MREEFILNIYKNDEWAPLWAVEDKAQRVLGIMEQRNETQRLGIGKGRYGETEIFAQGGGGVKISHKGGVVCEFRKVLFFFFYQTMSLRHSLQKLTHRK